ncbi:orotidine-5'-phosphate decarboxylase [Collinsella sp. zg1085]|uniref:orotidine-5'-phosphate decarboxylase n=1 Tax=Collinsella sp. zg1085 TaxID=2844380 RepID=UPI001C0DA5B4|nr:orotidine-5'-phosphate decarboxylase [Collinsella sp. zg1085]QWT16968.1 orotidine-5'-phosphate decarboxylase [Collinsella sp. zg1085]
MVAHQLAHNIMVALDTDASRALELAHMLSGQARWVKVGMTLFYAEGPRIITSLKQLGYQVFLDLKLHDIPHQIEGALVSAASTGANLITVHGLGGKAMLEAAARGAKRARSLNHPVQVIAVTVLTSMDASELGSIGIADSEQTEALRLAELARNAGLHGVVCSAHEAHAMRTLLGPDALVVTPGIRPAGTDTADQRRVATATEAIKAGASHLVVGRPITNAQNPCQAFEKISQELNGLDFASHLHL